MAAPSVAAATAEPGPGERRLAARASGWRAKKVRPSKRRPWRAERVRERGGGVASAGEAERGRERGRPSAGASLAAAACGLFKFFP